MCHIVQTFSIFDDRTKSIDLCISRFDNDTKEAFKDLYALIDDTTSTEDESSELSGADIDNILDNAIYSTEG